MRAWNNINSIIDSLKSKNVRQLTQTQFITYIEGFCGVERGTATKYMDMMVRHNIFKKEGFIYTMIEQMPQPQEEKKAEGKI